MKQTNPTEDIPKHWTSNYSVYPRMSTVAGLFEEQAGIAGENIAVLSAGTDGIDGNSPAAGAVADGTTAQRALAARLDPTTALETFNAYPLFHSLGDAIITGPTGNNVRDLRILLAY